MLQEKRKISKKYVFVHGLGQNSSSWDNTLSFFAEEPHISCPDLLSILNQEEAIYANLYQAFSDYCNDIPGALNLCGLSLGAILTLNFTLDYPEKVQSLVLIGAQYKIPKLLLKAQNLIFQFMPQGSPATAGFQKIDMIKLTNSMINLDFSERLKGVMCSTLVLCGEQDNSNKKAAQNLAQNIQNAEFHLVENAGHEVNIDAPHKLASILCGFYQNLRQGGKVDGN